MTTFKTADIVIDYHLSAEQDASIPQLLAHYLGMGEKPEIKDPDFMTVIFRPHLSAAQIAHIERLLEDNGCRRLPTDAGNKWTRLRQVELNTTLVWRLEKEGFGVCQMDTFAEIEDALSSEYLRREAA